MNEEIPPKVCADTGCNNKPYDKNYLMPRRYEWLCKKHYFLCNYGRDINYERQLRKKEE